MILLILKYKSLKIILPTMDYAESTCRCSVIKFNNLAYKKRQRIQHNIITALFAALIPLKI